MPLTSALAVDDLMIAAITSAAKTTAENKQILLSVMVNLFREASQGEADGLVWEQL